jgi:hypothetical protein
MRHGHGSTIDGRDWDAVAGVRIGPRRSKFRAGAGVSLDHPAHAVLPASCSSNKMGLTYLRDAQHKPRRYGLYYTPVRAWVPDSGGPPAPRAGEPTRMAMLANLLRAAIVVRAARSAVALSLS